ncbi:MAG: hypothetical protein QM765_24765 [Myxococcales bacterium]
MKSLKVGAVLLSVWSGLNLLVAAAVTVLTLRGAAPPALGMLMTEAEALRLDPRALAVVNAQAALANPCIVALCAIVLAVVWTSLVARARWALWTLSGALLPLQAFGFVSDAYLGGRNFAANTVSSVVLLAGLGLCARGVFSRGADSAAVRPPSL